VIPEETKTFEGRHGESQYITVALPFKDGYKLGLELAGLMTPILGGAAGALFGVASIDDQMDFGGAVSEIGRLPQRLLELGDDRLVKRILARTYRIEDNKKRNLREDNELTNAFAGNYSELIAVMWWVLGVNYAPFGMGDNPALEELRSKLSKLLSVDSLNALIPGIEETSSESTEDPSAAESA
jgi:hypothetical protein